MLYLDLAHFAEQRRRFRITTGGRFDLKWEDLLDPEPRGYAEKFFRTRPPE